MGVLNSPSRLRRALLLTIAMATCAASCTTLDDVIAPSCAFALSSTSATFGNGGGTGTVTVHAPASCGWTVTASDAWIAVTSPTSGSGDADIGFSVAANAGAPARSATLNVSGQSFTVSQSGAPPCTYGVTSSAGQFPPAGGTGRIIVTAGDGCPWTAGSHVNWISITSGSNGAGNGETIYVVAENTSKNNRTGTITVAGRAVTVSQARSRR